MPRPSVEFPPQSDLGYREWGTETLIVKTPYYIGKRLDMKAGKAGGLQLHRQKVESFLLVSGRAEVDFDGGAGCLRTATLLPGDMVHVPAGAPHRVRAIEDCVFYEWSTPVFDDRERVEAEYGQPETGGLPTT